MKNPNDPLGNRKHDIPACGLLPRPKPPQLTTFYDYYADKFSVVCCLICKIG